VSERAEVVQVAVFAAILDLDSNPLASSKWLLCCYYK